MWGWACARAVGVCVWAVPEALLPLIQACQKGNLARVQELWVPEQLPLLNGLSKEECCHPLLCATHNLQLEVVRFLCDAVRAGPAASPARLLRRAPPPFSHLTRERFPAHRVRTPGPAGFVTVSAGHSAPIHW